MGFLFLFVLAPEFSLSCSLFKIIVEFHAVLVVRHPEDFEDCWLLLCSTMITSCQLNCASLLHENQLDGRDSVEGPKCRRASLASRGCLQILTQLLLICMVIPAPLAQMVDQRQHVQCDDIQPIYDKETLPGAVVGFWSVFHTSSTHKTHSEPNPNLVIEHPACLLVKMKLIVRLGNTTLVDVPETAQSQNDTCYLPKEEHLNKYDRADYTYTPQLVQLTWSDDDMDIYADSSLTLVFSSGPQQGIGTKGPKIRSRRSTSYSKSHVFSALGQGDQRYDQWYWMSRFELQTPTVTIKLKDMKVFPTPMLFAYACKGKEITFEVMAKVNGQEEKVFLSFHHLEIEAFRENRYYTSMTHLKWDCHVGWPYNKLPLIVNGIIILIVLLAACYIYIRCRKSKNRGTKDEKKSLLPNISKFDIPNMDMSITSFDST